ncbi:1343_t:CDS:2 [Ambispora gerdemannii]|uniref:tRNA pseudouridine(55) synthase n=1 Tax=Ambispora gerdemannii TaxID=144530 RepID=A0A9N9GW07_9GLOM|nr:1343_t:CDS:2 [Ambispora gerdemannii]
MAKKVKLHGLFAVNKPRNKTSVEILEMINKVFRAHAAATRIEMTKRKVVKLGHGGTLDPMATGVLVVGVNDGCKEIKKYTFCDKVYEAVGMFGISTNTNDSEGKIIQRAPTEHITREKLEALLPKFVGTINQVPPLFSAIHMDGRRLYDYARSGDELPRDIEPRSVIIQSINLLDFTREHKYSEPTGTSSDYNEDFEDETKTRTEAIAGSEIDNNNNNELTTKKGFRRQYVRPKRRAIPEKKQEDDEKTIYPIFKINVKCGSGTYIRSLIRDIGEGVNSVAHMVELVRLEQGEFKLGEDVLEFEDCLEFDNIYDAINNHNRKLRQLEYSQRY